MGPGGDHADAIGVVIMRIPGIACCTWLIAGAISVTSCGGTALLSPTGPSNAAAVPAALAGAPATGVHVLPVSGTVLPVSAYAAPCWADRYACEVVDFSKATEGPIEVTLTWEGAPRSMRVQLYWVGGTLAHEDIAPANGPSRISFSRPRMEAAAYRLRVVSMDPQAAIPFTLTVAY